MLRRRRSKRCSLSGSCCATTRCGAGHRLSQGLTIGENDQGLLTIFGGDGSVTDGYTDLDDREENTLWDELCAVKPVIKQHLQNIINSNYVPAYHPFRYYLEHLPPWTPDKGDAIMGLSLTVNVKGDADEQILFYQYLKKWLVAMVASWVEPRVVNNVMLILIGVQGSTQRPTPPSCRRTTASCWRSTA